MRTASSNQEERTSLLVRVYTRNYKMILLPSGDLFTIT